MILLLLLPQFSFLLNSLFRNAVLLSFIYYFIILYDFCVSLSTYSACYYCFRSICALHFFLAAVCGWIRIFFARLYVILCLINNTENRMQVHCVSAFCTVHTAPTQKNRKSSSIVHSNSKFKLNDLLLLLLLLL